MDESEKSLKDLSVEELTLLWLGGNKDAFGELTERYKKNAMWRLRRMNFREPEAEDFIQDMNIKAMKARRTFKRDLYFGPWYIRIVTREAIHKIKKNIRERRNFKEYLKNYREVAIYNPDIAEKLALNEVLEKAKYMLSEEKAYLYHMRMERGLSFPLIADLLGEPVSTIKSRYYKAIEELIEILQKFLDGRK